MARKLLVGLMLLAGLSGMATSGRAKQGPTIQPVLHPVNGPVIRPVIRLTISVFNDAEVPAGVLRAAQTRAETVLSGAGIALTWLDCGTPGNWVPDIGCRDIAFPSHFAVRLARNGKYRNGDVFGESFLDDKGVGDYASVYVEPLEASKAVEVIREGDLLGYVVVHELGHLLLGLGSHSAEGVMRGKWDMVTLRQAAHGTLIFSAGEAERMRARCLLASAGQNFG